MPVVAMLVDVSKLLIIFKFTFHARARTRGDESAYSKYKVQCCYAQ